MLLITTTLVAAGCGQDTVDIRAVDPDLTIPNLSDGPPRPGMRFKETLPEYSETDVYHVTYLPTDWQPDRSYPVIVEYAGNGSYESPFGDVSTGLAEDSKLGFGISGGEGLLWVCVPYLNDAADANVKIWWGDRPTNDPTPTIEYCKAVVPWICEKYGGDPERVVLAGFSRGAIAVNFIGLHDDEIADLWCGLVAFSHYDGVVDQWGYPGCDRDSARRRLARLGNRPQFICAETGEGKHSVNATASYLESTGIEGNFEFHETGFRNHNDAWILRPGETRNKLRDWLMKLVE